jgi:hypothetical protein
VLRGENCYFCYCLYACRYSIVIRSRRKKRCEPITSLLASTASREVFPCRSYSLVMSINSYRQLHESHQVNKLD